MAPGIPNEADFESEPDMPTGLLTREALAARAVARTVRKRNEQRRKLIETQDLKCSVVCTDGGVITDIDRGNWYAEVEAILQVALAACAAQATVHFIVDNTAALAMLQSAMRQEVKPPAFGFGQWLQLRQVAKNRNHTAEWCPSHGKQQHKWESIGLRSSPGVRMLNNKADEMCNHFKPRAWENLQSLKDETDTALAWSRSALAAMETGGRLYAELMSQRAAARGGEPESDD